MGFILNWKKYFKKHLQHKYIILFLLFFYTFTRSYNLSYVPIFTDEAIYLRWAQIANADLNKLNLRPLFISLSDGKGPTFIWVIMFAMRLIADPVIAGRVVSILAGLFTMLGLFFLGKELFKNVWIGVLSALLYIIFPMALVYDRMALYDSVMATFTVWGLYLEVLLIQKRTYLSAALLGVVSGVAAMTKTNGFFIILLLPFSLILINWSKNKRIADVINWMPYAFFAAVASYIIYSTLRISPYFYIIGQKNAVFIFPVSEWIHHPFLYFQSNMQALLDWFISYMTIPLLLLTVVSFVIHASYFRAKALLALWFILPFVALGLFGKLIYPRYILFMVVPLLPLAAFSLFSIYRYIKNLHLWGVILLLFLAFPVYTEYLILTNFAQAPIPKSDRGQYYSDWPAGGGVPETVNFLKKEAEKGKVVVATQGTFGLMPYALELYLVHNPNVKIIPVWPINDIIPEEVALSSKKASTYFVFYQPCTSCPGKGLAPSSWRGMKIVLQVRKAKPDAYFTLYQVLPQ